MEQTGLHEDPNLTCCPDPFAGGEGRRGRTCFSAHTAICRLSGLCTCVVLEGTVVAVAVAVVVTVTVF